MSIEENVRIVKDFLMAMGSGDEKSLLSLSAKDIEWIVPGKDWPLAGTYRGHSGLKVLLKEASDEMETSFTKPLRFVAQGKNVLVIGVATGKIKATNKAWEDHWVVVITIRHGKLTHIREYVDTQALAQASQS